jgi:23S rRNA (adenine2503-C2)-methyltransferase
VPLIPLLEQTADQFRDWFRREGLPPYRAGQVHKWLFQRRAGGFDEMTDLPAALRERLAAEFQIWTTRVEKHLAAADGAEKLLLGLHDGERIECVLLRDDKEHCTACISTQVGCAMGCAFCATGLDGVARNLSCGEILEQLLQLQRVLAPADTKSPSIAPRAAAGPPRPRPLSRKQEREDFNRSPNRKRESGDFNRSPNGKRASGNLEERLSHVVVMGMGEPLLNLDALLPALAVASSRDGLGIGARRITISTVGLPAGIRRLATENCQYHLAVSLHAADDALRNQLVEANRGVGIAAILSAADEYFERTGRRVTFECVLLAGVNDGVEQARQLVQLLRGRPSLVNVIPYNPVPGLPYRRPLPAVTARFVEALTQGGLNVNIRHRKGDRIHAACGQLRRGSGGREP